MMFGDDSAMMLKGNEIDASVTDAVAEYVTTLLNAREQSGSLQGSPAMSVGSLSDASSDTEGTTPTGRASPDLYNMEWIMDNVYMDKVCGEQTAASKLSLGDSPIVTQPASSLMMEGIAHEGMGQDMDPQQHSHLAELCQDTERQLSSKELLDKIEDALQPTAAQSEGDSAMLMEPLFPEVVMDKKLSPRSGTAMALMSDDDLSEAIDSVSDSFDTSDIEEEEDDSPKSSSTGMPPMMCDRVEPGRNTCRYSGCVACGRTQKSKKRARSRVDKPQMSASGEGAAATQRSKRNTMDPCLQEAWIDLDQKPSAEGSDCEQDFEEPSSRTRRKSAKAVNYSEDDFVVTVREFDSATAESKPKRRKVVDPSRPAGSKHARYWSDEEHLLFLEGLEKYGARDVRSVSALVKTRSPVQVRTHAQKYFLKFPSAPQWGPQKRVNMEGVPYADASEENEEMEINEDDSNVVVAQKTEPIHGLQPLIFGLSSPAELQRMGESLLSAS